jgi:hypothetical protein
MDHVLGIIGDYISDMEPMTYETQRCIACMPYFFFSKLSGNLGINNPLERFPLLTQYTCDISVPIMTKLFDLDNTSEDELDIPSMTLDGQGFMMKLPMPSMLKSIVDNPTGRYVVFPVDFVMEMLDPKTKQLDKDDQKNISGHIGIMLFDTFTKKAELIDPNGSTGYFSGHMDKAVKQASEIPLVDLINFYVVEYIQSVSPDYTLVPQKDREYNLNYDYKVKGSIMGNCKIITLMLYCIFDKTDADVKDILEALHYLSDAELYNIIARFCSYAMLQSNISFGDDQHFQKYITKTIPEFLLKEQMTELAKCEKTDEKEPPQIPNAAETEDKDKDKDKTEMEIDIHEPDVAKDASLMDHLIWSMHYDD